MMNQAAGGVGVGKNLVHASLIQRLRRLWPYFSHLPGTWVLVVTGALVNAMTEPMIPALLKPLLDQGFQQGALEIWTVPAALLLLFGVRGLASYISQIGLTKISNHGLLLLRRAIFNKILVADMSLYSTQTSSGLSNSVVYEAQTGALLLISAFLSLTRNGLTLIALTAYLFFLNWKLTLIVAAVFPAIAWVMRALTRRLHRLTKASQDATDDLAYVVEENFLAHRDIRLYAAQPAQAERFERLSQTLRRLAMKSTIAGAATTPLTQMLAAVALSIVISIALAQSTANATTVGGFAAFITAMLMIVAPIRQLSELSSPITRGLAALERGVDLIDSFPNERGGAYSVPRTQGDIQFSQVSVRYSPDAAPAVQNVDLVIKTGEMVALVGASGSGKSSLVNLLPRFVEISTGKVLLDGHDVREWSLESLRAQFSFVSQHVVLLNDSIAANVALGMAADRSKIAQCLHTANLGSWIEQLPQGIDTLVGHNAMQVSGGQRQRLAIARALYKDAPILVFDEATSALDTESERMVQDAMQNLMRNRTTLVIAHRLSTVKHADRIVVMDAGTIVEMGTHDVLIAKNGPYAHLYKLGLHSSEIPFAP